jgi:hypothetical protein
MMVRHAESGADKAGNSTVYIHARLLPVRKHVPVVSKRAGVDLVKELLDTSRRKRRRPEMVNADETAASAANGACSLA